VIELFDTARLLPRRDHSLAIAGGVMAVGLIGLGAHGVGLQRELISLQSENNTQLAELNRLKVAEAAPTPALLADLEQRARQLESEVATATGGVAGSSPTPSQWLERLDALGNPEVGLSRIEIDRAGSARIEGVARNPQAMSGYVQAWERENAPAPMRARAIEVRQDDKAAPLLRFQMRANLPGPVVQ
jgi:hypothetical protein